MLYETEKLAWVKDLPTFSDEEQRVLLALSDSRFQ